MLIVDQISYLFGGIIVMNAVPHLVSGVLGRPFQSPFAKPPGVGLSSSLVNVLWGFFNLVIGYLLLCQVGHFDMRTASDAFPLGFGIFIGSIIPALVFGRLHGGNLPDAPSTPGN